MKLKLPLLSLVEEYKLGKARLFQMLWDSCNSLMKNAQPSVITGQKQKVKITVENTKSALKMIEIIGTVANGRVGLGLHPHCWWSKESTINKRKVVSEEIHHLATRIATAIRQRKRAHGPSGRVQMRELSHGTPKIKFPDKGSLQHLTNTSQPSCLGLTTSDRCRACGKTASLKCIPTGWSML